MAIQILGVKGQDVVWRLFGSDPFNIDSNLKKNLEVDSKGGFGFSSGVEIIFFWFWKAHALVSPCWVPPATLQNSEFKFIADAYEVQLGTLRCCKKLLNFEMESVLGYMQMMFVCRNVVEDT